VAYGWVAFTPEPVGDLGFSFRVGPDEAYIYDCATRPRYRGRGYYPALLRYVLADLRGGACRRAWIATAPGNAPSQHGIIRAGFTKVADVRITHRPDGTVAAELYGVPGIPLDVLKHGAWAFHGHPYPETGLPAVRLSER
jgi:RimJ/RimL family protein N-acetyltransferase